MVKLFGYWRSSASYRVRLALALKGIDFEYVPVNLLEGEQHEPSFLQKNPLAVVPALETDDGAIIIQSLAIIEFLEKCYPETPILPEDPVLAAHARAISMTIAAEAQPFMNLRIQNYLNKDAGLGKEGVTAWLEKWPAFAMAAVERMVKRTGGTFCVGDAPSIADCCLVPQMFAADRFGIDSEAFPALQAIAAHCNELPAFQHAHPLNQPDAPSS